MPTSPSTPTVSSPLDDVSEADAVVALGPRPAPVRWKVPLLLFVASALSILLAGATYAAGYAQGVEAPLRLRDGLPFAAALLAILLTHEFGHYIAARIHRVNASLPMFIPLPFVGLFGTMGAIIVMRDRIRSRNALLDIGASGPLAGMAVAIPVLLYGLSHSRVGPPPADGLIEGQCLLYWLLKRIAIGAIPAGQDVLLSPVALAGWVGLFVTMMNLLPTGQLDGGHVAYALFGEKQIRFAAWVRYALLGLAFVNLVYNTLVAYGSLPLSQALLSGVATAGSWVVWFVVLSVMSRMSQREHPPTDPGELSPGRRVVAAVTLLLFVLLFMPTIMRSS